MFHHDQNTVRIFFKVLAEENVSKNNEERNFRKLIDCDCEEAEPETEPTTLGILVDSAQR